jgi:signal transduction histidine kinase
MNDRTLADRDNHIGDTVEATGIWISGQNNGTRRHIGQFLHLIGGSPLRTITVRKADIFNAPLIKDMKSFRPDEIPPLERRRVTGTVLTAWQGGQALIRTDDGNIVRIDLSSPPVPKAGHRIEAVGFPETDLYAINLNNVRWRPMHGNPIPPQPPVRLPKEYIRIGEGTPQQMQAAFHGRMVVVAGIVRGLPQGEHDWRLILECEENLLPIDFSSCPEAIAGLVLGSTIEVRGVWVMVADNWRPNSVFPKVKGAFVVVNAPKDLRVLARPSWWTPGRLLTVIGTLFVILIGVGAWNRALKAVAERTKRKLREEVIAHVASDLRVGERTSLAVELHDTIAQNLTGVALEINAANKLVDSDLSGAHRHLDTAAKTLSSCRTELKNCLFDLRGNALGQRDMDTAIRLSVAPVIGDAELAVRFNVPRERITDASAHAIIRIVRELASNAVRHGGARKVKVAGSADEGMLLFSVSDDGCGFVVDQAPGIDECHFGLQGIRERVAHFQGKMDIESTTGKGTKVVIKLKS